MIAGTERNDSPYRCAVTNSYQPAMCQNSRQRMGTNTSLIGVDWGTTNLRAFRFGATGAVRESREAAQGVARIQGKQFEQALFTFIDDWLQTSDPPATLILCGMIGSREGWREAPYLDCPADPTHFAGHLVQVPNARAPVWIVPGLTTRSPSGASDVMRGEETQIFGAVEDIGRVRVIAPGTHSKWARVENGRIVEFRTFMSGELYAVLCEHSILGRLMQGTAYEASAFTRGVQRSFEDPALLGSLFSARTEGLFGRIAPKAIAAYLSGLIVGSEVREALAAHPLASDEAVQLIASAATAEPYARALEAAGVHRCQRVDGSAAAARGLWRLATRVLN